MENGTITLSEALEIMRRRDSTGRLIHFNISFRKFSATTKRGGALREIDGAIYMYPENPDADKPINIYNLLDPVVAAKNPNHFENRTRNIQLPDGKIRKVNIDFIISINDQKVIY
jgi:hypothetical protein